jgi:gliding motility-associated-like protein
MYRIGHIVCFLLWALTAQSQGDLCNTLPAGSGVGGFDIVGGINSGCSPLRVEVVNTSGSTNVYYDFDYRGQDLSSLKYDTLSKFPLFANTVVRNYEILQYGKDASGKAIYACKRVSVRPPLVVSYTVCNNDIEIQVPTQYLASNSKLVYKLGTASDKEIVSVDLPYESTPQASTFPKNLKYYVKDNSGNVSCENTLVINKPISGTLVNPYFAVIKSLEMISGDKVAINFTGSFTTIGYEMFYFEKGGAYPNTPIRSNVLPGEYDIILPDSTKSYCFMVSRQESCGSTERSEVLCTVPLDTIKYYPTENELNWVSHLNNPINPIFGYRNLRTEIIKEESGKAKETIPSLNTTETYKEAIDCKKKYCYQVVVHSEGIISNHPFIGVSTSLKRCISRKDISVPAISDLVLNIKDNQELELKYQDDSGWNLNKDIFYLWKYNNAVISKIDSSSSILPFLDKNADVSKGDNCYSVSYTDQCGSSSKLSPKVCNVSLNFDSDLLSWDSNLPFGKEVIGNYEIYEFNEVSNIESLVASQNNISFLPNLDAFETEAKFRIKILGVNGKVSHSNVLKIPIQAFFFVPTAFTPNGDGINDKLEIKGRFGRVQNFNLSIFNRWGEEIFSSTDRNQMWDGFLENSPALIGSYFFKLKVILTDGEVLINNGNFELIR